MARVRTAVLISGRGSNLGSLIEAARAPDYPAQIVLVISNRGEAGGLAIAAQAEIPAKVIAYKEFASREEFDAAIDAALREADVSVVCEAGFMRIHSEWFVKRWEGRILNIHPSLLPAFPGVRAHEQALAAGVKISGCTVHFLTAELDSGPIIAQASVPVLPGDTAETLAARVLEQEHKLYPAALKLVAEGKVSLENDRAVFG
ncbi:MAG TPA: phosphoribosylglycinamide formyltransferase [Rhizomicrobium sp.]|jgi:phosphoribosylglycinamide formyltransferase-1|nr:phosphoribosylglycinamide formyltransferase [Rhizomicrobium sp.]